MKPADRRQRVLVSTGVLFVLGGLISCSSNGGGPTPTPGTGSPTPQPSASSTASKSELPQLTMEFISVQHGYTIQLPAEWTASAATQPWAFGTDGDHAGDPTADTLRSPSSSGLVVSSQALPAGMTQDQWFAAYLAGGNSAHPECNPPRADWEPYTIDGHAAGVHGGLVECSFTEAVAVVAGRAYVFTAYPNLDALSGVVFNRPLLDALLGTVVFRAEPG